MNCVIDIKNCPSKGPEGHLNHLVAALCNAGLVGWLRRIHEPIHPRKVSMKRSRKRGVERKRFI